MDNFVEYGRLFAPHVNVLNFCSQFFYTHKRKFTNLI